jgi:hypothetical protein
MGLLPATRRIALQLAVLSLPALTTACARGAPAFEFFGAYFPAWLAAAIVAVVAAVFVRLLMVLSGLSEQLPHQLLICTAIGVIIGILSDWIGFGS